MNDSLFNSLNEKQKEAVYHDKGPSVILAGAGSGKTRVLTAKVIYLIEKKKIDPSQIVMITFTNKAAYEMKERIVRLLENTKKNSLGYIGTFHSFCAMILRRNGVDIGVDRNFVIYDDEDQKQLAKKIIADTHSERITPASLLYQISAAKNNLITPKRYLEVFSDYQAPLIAELYAAYEKNLLKNNAVDFDDLLMKSVQLFETRVGIRELYQRRYSYFFIDEFQDTNTAQYVLAKLLAAKEKNITVVGDFSQSIYSWRGADIHNLEKFQEDFSGSRVFYLEENYRSTQSILNFAYDVISQNQTHPILKLHTRKNGGEEVKILDVDNEEEEAFYIASDIEEIHKTDTYESCAVLYRTNAQSRVIEEAFLHKGIPYRLIGGTRFYERREIKDILSYLRLCVNRLDDVASDRIQKLGKRKFHEFKTYLQENENVFEQKETAEIMEDIFAKTRYLELFNPDNEEDYGRLENIKELKSVAMTYPNLILFLEQVALVESEYSEGEKKNKSTDGVRLMTLHQAKGLEFTYVYIVGLEEGILPHSRSVDDLFSLEEERRLFYVGITRARQRLTISHARRRFMFGRRNESVRSRFIGGESYV